MSDWVLYAVIGCHRGGTSATAGALAHLGVDFGRNLMPPSPDNPKGYYEDLDLVAIHDRVLTSAGASWSDPTMKQQPSKPAIARAQIEMASWLTTRGPIAGFKDPRATLMPHLWMAVADQCGYELRPIIVARATEDVAASLQRREGGEVERWAELARAYYAACQQWIQMMPAARVLDYGDLLECPALTLRCATDGRFPNEQYLAAAKFIDPELNHA